MACPQAIVPVFRRPGVTGRSHSLEIITIKDIAKALNLSTSTVSRALRDSHEINAETKRLVQEYAERVRYSPNPIALSLKEKGSRSIGVIVPEIANPFFSQAINGMESVAYSKGYHVVICQSFESYEREVINTGHLVSRRVDGLLVSLSSLTTETSHFADLERKGMPIVFFDRVPDERSAHKIITDNVQVAYDATAHLLRSGARRPAQVTSAPWLSTTRERLAGYEAAVRDAGLVPDEGYIRHCLHGGMVLEEIEAAVVELFEQEAPPDAIFAASDRLTTGCLSILKKMGKRVPGDVSLVGFTNLPAADLFDPPLTTVVQPAFEMGKSAMEWLIGLIEGPKGENTFASRLQPGRLVIRASSQKSA